MKSGSVARAENVLNPSFVMKEIPASIISGVTSISSLGSVTGLSVMI